MDGADDDTQVSPRTRADAVDDATQLSGRARAAHVSEEVEDDEDSTQVAASTRGRRARTRPNLPPGRIAGPRTEPGSFGQTEESYRPRAVPVARSMPTPTPVSSASAESQGKVLTPEQAARRREAARKRRLSIVIVVACVAAAAVTAMVLAAIALLGGAS